MMSRATRLLLIVQPADGGVLFDQHWRERCLYLREQRPARSRGARDLARLEEDWRLERLAEARPQRAVAQEAPILLLDEPTSALDLGRQQQALELVAELREHDGLTVLSAMHELTLAAQYADRLLLLSDGRLVAVGAPEEIATEELISTHYRAEVRVYSDGQGPVAVIPVRKGKRL